MHEHLASVLDALDGVKLLPPHALESDVIYGYVAQKQRQTIVARVVEALSALGYDVHRCEWADEVVLMAMHARAQPLALRLTASADERYNLYALSRPRTAPMLWQWAQSMIRDHQRKRREYRS